MSLWGNSDADEAKPKWLTAAQKKLTFADARGWVYKQSDNHQEEVLCAIGELATSIGQADITDITWVTTAFDKSDGGTLSVTARFNEAVDVTGTPQLTVVNDQRTNHTLSYASGTGTNELVFTLAIPAANAATNADDVLSIGANAMALNGGTVKDAGTTTVSAITNSAAIGTAAGTITVVA